MNYVIKNHKNIYIRLNENGSPVTCRENDKGLFEQSKAKNILGCLPKTLRRLNFRVDCIPDIVVKKPESKPLTVIKKDNYDPPDEVMQWINKFGICDEILTEARIRKEELTIALSNADKELSNEVHKIELETWKNACGGYSEYKTMKNILEKRRIIKDELMVISRILNMNFSNFDGETLNKAIKKLATRKFTYRMVEDSNYETM